jgi:23S rRNA (pseudouridine1915-N3)-methyltransferase
LRLILITVGRLKAGPERELFERYAKRIGEMTRTVGIGGFDWREVEEGRARRTEDRQSEEARAIKAALPAGAKLILCDERGKSLTSVEFATDIGAARDGGDSAYALAIGGPEGFEPS